MSTPCTPHLLPCIQYINGTVHSSGNSKVHRLLAVNNIQEYLSNHLGVAL